MSINAALERLAAHAESLLELGQAESARLVFEFVIGRGHAVPTFLVMYAVCLAELDEGERAIRVLDEVATGMRALPESSIARAAFCDLEIEARKWLPGGKFAKDTQAELGRGATRFFPKLSPGE